jgi:tetratricopeptide (TPR) repeat protein
MRETTRAKRAETLAEARLAEAEAVTKYLVDAFKSPDPTRNGRTFTVAEMLDRAEKQVDDNLDRHPLKQATLLLAIGETRNGLGMASEAIPAVRRALDLRAAELGPAHPDTLKVMNQLATIYVNAGKPKDAISLLKQVLRTASKSDDRNDALRLWTMNGLGAAYRVANQPEKAIRVLTKVYDARLRQAGERDPATITSMTELGVAYSVALQWDNASRLLEKALALSRDVHGPEHPTTLFIMNSLANVHQGARRYDEAIQLHESRLKLARQSLGDDHPNTALSLVNLGFTTAMRARAYRDDGNVELFETTIRQAVADNLKSGRFTTAFILARSSENIDQLSEFIERAISLDHHAAMTGFDAMVLGEIRIAAGQPAAAEPALRTAIVRHTTPAYAYRSLGWALLAQKKREEAKQAFETVLINCRQPDGTYSLTNASQDELTAAYFTHLITQNEYLDRITALHESITVPWFFIGQQREIDGHLHDAIDAYEQCIRLAEVNNGLYAFARYRLAKLNPSSRYANRKLPIDPYMVNRARQSTPTDDKN